jgi:aromatic ring-opening dioxygenase catalytic subunit (LigB family)
MFKRFRRLRINENLRNLVTETKLDTNDFIYPLFIKPGIGIKKEIDSMPGVYQMSIDNILKECKELQKLGLKSIILFGIPEVKDSIGSDALCDHGIMVPLSFLTPNYDLPVIPCNINCQGPPLTPLARVWQFGEALRRACDEQSEKIALVGTGGISHWPATPDSGKINEAWDRNFLDQLMNQDKTKILSYIDEEVYQEAGQGGFEIRTLIAAAAAAGGKGELQFYSAELPIFAVGCTVARFDVGQ